VARPGVDAEYFSPPDFQSPDGVPSHWQHGISGVPYILFVGNLEKRKGLDILLNAFAALTQSLPHHLVIAGKDRGALRQVTSIIDRAGLRERIHLPGYVPPEQMLGLYRGASLLVLPALSEGFGIPPLEAM